MQRSGAKTSSILETSIIFIEIYAIQKNSREKNNQIINPSGYAQIIHLA